MRVPDVEPLELTEEEIQAAIANDPPTRSRRHWFGCNPKIAPTYGAAYDCPRCGRHWVSNIAPGAGYYWVRHGWRV